MRFHVVPKDGKREKQHRTAMQLMLFYGYTQAEAVAEVLKLNLSDE